MTPVSVLNRPSGLPVFLRLVSAGLLVAISVLVTTDQPLRAASTTIVISQVYGGGGGTSGSPSFRSDYIELFNRGTTSVSLAGWSLQYASAAGTGNFSGNPITTLPSVTLAPGQYFLVQESTGTVGSVLSPSADLVFLPAIAMSATAGKIALVNTTTGLTCNGGSTPCSAAQLALIVDLVGYGTANFYEGSGAAPTLSATSAAFRLGGGCTDTDNNAADFTAGVPSPRNTASTFAPCASPTQPAGVGAANPALASAGDQVFLTVTVTPGSSPASTGLAVSADLSAIGGAAGQSFFDDGTNGDVTAGDNVFSFGAVVLASTTTGAKSLPFTVSDAQSRSSSGTIALTITSPPIAIHDIQGAGSDSPYDGQVVTTRGVVTGRRYNNGFFIQALDTSVDADPNTSEGIFVFTSSAPPAVAAVGACVQVTGSVQEYIPSADPASPSMTEIAGGPVVSAWPVTPCTMPQAITLSQADLTSTNTLANLERLEGMRVHVDALRVVGPTDGSVNETNATGTSNGVFFGVIDGQARPFREEGIDALDPLPAGSPADVPRFDGNPERLRVDSDGQIGASKIEVTAGALVSNLTGPLDFAYRTWTILPDPSAPPVVSGLAMATPVPVPDATEFTVASFNLERFFDTVDDPAISEPVLTLTAFNNRLNKASLAIRTMMRAPDILGVEEVENLSTLQALAAKINADAVAAGDPDPGYQAYLEEGNDVGGIDVGFLVKSARVSVVDVTQVGKDATYINPIDGLPEMLNDRPPLVLRADVQGPGGQLPVTVIVNHLRSLSGVDDPADGPRVRAKRAAQAEYLASLIQARQSADPEERIISVGDYNAYQVNDGYVDVMGTVDGTPAPPDQVVLATSDLVSPDLTDLVNLMPADQRYSYVYDGTAQVLDHILVNEHALQRLSRFHYARFGADFPESYRTDASRPERLSDHDAPVAYFIFPPAPLLVLAGPNPMAVECCTSFTEPGYTATDPDFGDITSQVNVTGSVDPHALGEYTLTYSVSNGYLTTTMTRTVNVVDTTPPVITDFTPAVSSLWPPNHSLVNVPFSYAVSDTCGAVTCELGVASNEPEDGTGDGDTSPDWIVVDARTVQLRAERAGTGDGRIYTVSVTCRDASGNASVASAAVRVPKSQSK